MKTTKECKQFLVDFFKNTPTLIPPMYDPEEGEVAQGFSVDEKNWKRRCKCKPLSEASYIHGESTDLWKKGWLYSEGSYFKESLSTANIAVERHFILKEDTLGTGVIFIVIEDTDGNLHLGDYIGD